MIQSVSELLRALQKQEQRKLDEFKLRHGPTIGKMYEGLTTKILNCAIPREFDLRVVSGFANDGKGHLSPELDCMLVRGEGESIPYTESFSWPIYDIIAVLEVKKTLYGKQLEEGFELLSRVMALYRSSTASADKGDTFDDTSLKRAFAQITGKVAPPFAELDRLEFSDRVIYDTLITEFLSPIRIILGYHGYQSEFAFREAMFRYLGKNLFTRGFGVSSF